MCAEEIPLTSVACEYCSAQFEVTSRGYCETCHQVREANGNGQCKVCVNAVLEWRMESKFIEEMTAQAIHSLPDYPSLTPKSSGARIWFLGGELAHKKEQLARIGDENGNTKIIESLRAELMQLGPQAKA